MKPVIILKRFLYLFLANFLKPIYKSFTAIVYKISQYFISVSKRLTQSSLSVSKKAIERVNGRLLKTRNELKKINLRSSIRPGFLRELIVIILLIISATFYMLKEEEKAQKIFTQEQLVRTNKIKDVFAAKLIDTIETKKIVEEKLVTEKKKVVSLKREVEERNEQILLTLDRLEEEKLARRKAEAQLIIALTEKRSLETELRKFTNIEKPVELEKIVVKPASELIGKVLAANKEHNFIVVNLGRDELSIGDILSVYHGDKFIGTVHVERVAEKMSAARILSGWQSAEFMENDEVRKW